MNTELNLEIIEKQEQSYRFKEFRHEYALTMMNAAVNYIKNNGLRRVGIRITYKDLLIGQYLMDGKNEDLWLIRKERTVLDSGHATAYVERKMSESGYEKYMDLEVFAPAGGGFPIYEGDEITGVISISGMTSDEDHQLVIEVLEELKQSGVELQ